MQHSTYAIVLKRIAYGDADWIVTLFSRDIGRFSGLARSARKSRRRFAGAFEPGTLVNVSFLESRGGGLARLTEATPVRPLNGVTKSLERIHALTQALEIALSFLQERQAAPEKFDLLSEFILTLSERDPEGWDVLTFKFKWISHSGFRPHLGSCALCRKKRDDGKGWSFDLENGGLICGSCAKRSMVSVHLTGRALRGLTELESGNLFSEEPVADDAERVINRYITHIIGKPLRSGGMYFK